MSEATRWAQEHFVMYPTNQRVIQETQKRHKVTQQRSQKKQAASVERAPNVLPPGEQVHPATPRPQPLERRTLETEMTPDNYNLFLAEVQGGLPGTKPLWPSRNSTAAVGLKPQGHPGQPM